MKVIVKRKPKSTEVTRVEKENVTTGTMYNFNTVLCVVLDTNFDIERFVGITGAFDLTTKMHAVYDKDIIKSGHTVVEVHIERAENDFLKIHDAYMYLMSLLSAAGLQYSVLKRLKDDIDISKDSHNSDVEKASDNEAYTNFMCIINNSATAHDLGVILSVFETIYDIPIKLINHFGVYDGKTNESIDKVIISVPNIVVDGLAKVLSKRGIVNKVVK